MQKHITDIEALDFHIGITDIYDFQLIKLAREQSFFDPVAMMSRINKVLECLEDLQEHDAKIVAAIKWLGERIGRYEVSVVTEPSKTIKLREEANKVLTDFIARENEKKINAAISLFSQKSITEADLLKEIAKNAEGGYAVWAECLAHLRAKYFGGQK